MEPQIELLPLRDNFVSANLKREPRHFAFAFWQTLVDNRLNNCTVSSTPTSSAIVVLEMGSVSMSDMAPARFQNYHPWDRNFFLLYVALIWLGICAGFGPDILSHIETHAPPYPLIVHFHAPAFVAWLVLLTTQVLLVRAGRADIHRKLGIVGAALAIVMVMLGPATAIVVDGLQFGTPKSDPAFISVQLTDMLAFAGLVTGGILWRKDAATHKRFMLLATLYISDAGFARWLGQSVMAYLGAGFWAMGAGLYGASDTLIVGLGIYDLITRRRLHSVYLSPN